MLIQNFSFRCVFIIGFEGNNQNTAPVVINSFAVYAVTPLDHSAKIRLRGQAVKTSPFHGGNTGSIPVGVILDL